MEVQIETRKEEKEKRVCELCGNSDGLVDIWVGGYFSFAHHKCAEIANRGIQLYQKMLILRPNGLEILVSDLTKAERELEKSFKGVKAKSTFSNDAK